MPNNTISQVEVNGTTYDLLDANTLSAVSSLESRVTTLEDSVAQDDIVVNGWYPAVFNANGSPTINPIFVAHLRVKAVNVTKSQAFIDGSWINVTYSYWSQYGDLIDVGFNKPSGVDMSHKNVLMNLTMTISF